MKAERPVAMGGVALEEQGFAVSVAMEQWDCDQPAFVMEAANR